MAKLTPNDILKLAKLAKIRLSVDEITQFGKEINEVLDYVEQLSSVDTADFQPTSQVTGLVNQTEQDEIIDYGITQEELLKNLPDQENDQIKVKRVLG
ncbi:MAG: Asp-tRNA(Asn)/Glu-tRNA(Gln) amidotransferase subunit GatC [bacterium]|nr:Asp-tRNA(Asn)/Glu-tRNA(Gln) amidotransferase subunit GatC [bacterium]